MTYARIDHVVLQVPDVGAAHASLRALGFDEAWPIGRNWPHGPTSGIALGGINLELLQPDLDPPAQPALAEIVFAPDLHVPMEVYGAVVGKVESDPVKLAARGFPPQMQERPQHICTNAFPGPDALWPHFVCDYAPLLAHRLAQGLYATPHGIVRHVEAGPLTTAPRFVVPPDAPDLTTFLSALHLETGPKLRSGPDRIVFWSGEALDLRSLTIIGSIKDERSIS